MALSVSIDQLNALTRVKYIPKLVDNIFGSNALLASLKKKGSFKVEDGGTTLRLPLNYATTSAGGWYSGADTLDTSDNNNITAAEYTWKQGYANVTILRDEELKNMGDSQVLDLVKSKMQIAEKTLAQALAGGLFNSGTDADAIVGLGSIISASNTVGGISQTTNSWWAGQLDSSTTVLSVPHMQTQWNASSVGNDHPTLIVSNRTIFNLYHALLQPQQRFTDAETVKGGFLNLMFNSTPLVVDTNAASSTLYMVNENYLMLAVHKEENFRFSGFQKPTNQNLKNGQIFLMTAFGSSNNRMHARSSAIAS